MAPVNAGKGNRFLNANEGSSKDGLRGLDQAERNSLVSTFEEAVVAHANWRTNFAEVIRNGGAELDSEVVRRDNICPLGRWLNGSGEQAVGNTTAHRMLCTVHAEFHAEAARVLLLAQRGRIKEAQHAMQGDQAYGTWSTILVAALSQYASSFGDSAAG